MGFLDKGLPQTFNLQKTQRRQSAVNEGLNTDRKPRATHKGTARGRAGKTQRPILGVTARETSLPQSLAWCSGLTESFSLRGLAGPEGGDPERQDTRACHLPRHQCRPPTPLCGFGSSPWVLASLHLFHKLENFPGAGQAARGPGLPAASWGSLAWWLPLRLLLSLRLELLLPPLNLYPSISSSPL